MTREEIMNELQRLNERQLNCSSVIQSSDAHACKCNKLALSFQETYPEEYQEYVSALDEFHANESRIEELKILLEEAEDEELTETSLNS